MLEGMIIGAVVGLIAAVVALLRQSRQRKGILKALQEGGPQAAREALDKQFPPVTKLTIANILNQRERMAGLALLDDATTIQREVAGHEGPLTATVQVGSLGWLGVALRGDARTGAAKLMELSQKMEQEGGRLMGLVKKKTRAMAGLAASLAGVAIPPEEADAVLSLGRDQGMTQLILWKALSVALAKSGRGQEAEAFAAKVRAQTRALEDV